ncbi:MAG TPA: hypothetical protein VHL80_17540 [Polyangia bacterium]|nr:hypothetical protein [Polyangia bacterium]
MKRSRDEVLFAAGVALWIALMLLTWPRALSFGDEIGYVGRAKLLLAGHLGYVPGSPGVWVSTPHGTVSQYPLMPSLLLAPFLAVWPRASFALAMLAAVLLAATARAILRSWHKSPLWALLVLGHPTIVILARTDMADLPQTAMLVAAWWALRRGRAFATVAWLALLMAIKVTGVVLAAGLVASEVVASARALRARDRATWRRLGWGAAGGAAGGFLLLALNRLSTGQFGFVYDHSNLSTPVSFWPTYLPAHAPPHLAALLLDPPLLFMGAWAYWKRGERGPVLLGGGYTALMSAYFFIDTGANALESLVLSSRLILPVVALLLIGYGAWLDDLLARARGRAAEMAGDAVPPPVIEPRAAAVAAFALPLAVAAGISVRHARFQQGQGAVRDVASAAADAHGEHTLGVTENAWKAGLMHGGPTTPFDPARARPAVVFCSEVSASHRQRAPRRSCALPGYHVIDERDGFFALVRDDARGDAL